MVRAQLIVAADGANSPIRSELGITTSQESYSQSAVVANWLCTYPHLDTAFQWFLPGGDIIAMLPLPEKQVSMVWSTSPDHAAELLKLDQAQWLNQYSSYKILVEGHADERGTREYNFALGQRRAQTTRDYLVSKGVSASRLSTKSWGKEKPVAVCDDISCWSQNRRAVTTLTGGN
jgi:peptidoglycan-associated lipoprotein